MDAGSLFQLLRNTLSPSSEERKAAEQHLKEFSKAPGFSVTLLQLVASNEVDVSVRQAGSIYLKNFVQKNWAPLDEDEDPIEQTPHQQIQVSEQDKAIIRANIVESIIHAPQMTRSQLLTTLGKIANADYPKNYGDLVPKLVSFLSSNDQNALYGALLSLYELVKKYEYKNSKEKAPLMQIIASTFPILHRLFGICVGMDSLEAALILKIISKIYYACIQFTLPKELRAHENLAPWIQAFIQLIEKTVPPVPSTTDQKHKFPWWQAKKWAYHILNRLFARYGNPSLSDKEYKKFAKDFLTTYAPQILQSYLKQLDIARGGSYISPRVMQLNLTYLSDAVTHAVTWKVLKPITLDLVKAVVFPLLCFSDEDQEMWESDPYEYVRNKFDVYEDFRSPVSAGIGLIHQLASSRKKLTLIPILSFCNEVLLNYISTPPNQRNPRAKDGALCIIGSISTILEKDENFKSQLEGLLVAHVLPEGDSPAPFLRARACWTIYNFVDIPFQNPQNVIHCLQVVAKCMKDSELPVKIQAALALGVLIGKEEVQAQIKPMLAEIMQELLNLTNESDIDDLSTVMENMIETFGEDMSPFAVSLSSQLRDTFLRIMGEAENEDDDNKAITAMGVLRTIVTFIRTMDESPEILAQLEQVFLPMIQVVLDQCMMDFLEEILEIVVTFTYATKVISPTMWAVLPSIYNCFKQTAADYFSEILPCLDNYISTNPAVFMSNPQNLTIVVDMFNVIMSGADSGEIEKSNALRLAEILLLNLPGQIDHLVPSFMEVALSSLNEAETTLMKVCSLEVVINTLYYNPRLSLQILEARGWTAPFFTAWFKEIDSFARVHDIKLSLLSLCKLFQLPYNEVPQIVKAGYGQAMEVFVGLFEKLPEAYENRKKLEELEEEEEDIDYDDEEIEDEDIENFGASDDEDVINAEDEEYMNMLKDKASNQEGEDDDDDFYGDVGLEEELDVSTPLDDVNEYIVFQEIFTSLQAQNPETLGALTKGLSPKQISFLGQLNELANQKRQELIQKQQQEQQATN